MTAALPLNTASAHTWAAVVSGAAWRRYTLSSRGSLEAEYMRGPLILWAIQPGEGKALAPAVVSPLETVLTLNTFRTFERFKWAAGGAVRPSVRWKISRKRKQGWKLDALDDLSNMALLEALQAEGCVQTEGWERHIGLLRSKSQRSKSVRRRAAQMECEQGRLMELAPLSSQCRSMLDYDTTGGFGIDEEVTTDWDYWARVLVYVYRPAALSPAERAIITPGWCPRLTVSRYSSMSAYFALTGKWDALAALLAHWRGKRPTLAALLLHFKRAAFQAFLARRVRSHARPGRVRRPLHARPRPPAAPLAPPVF